MTESLAATIVKQFTTLKTEMNVPDNEQCNLFVSQLNTLAHTVLRQGTVLQTMAAINRAISVNPGSPELPQQVAGIIQAQLNCRHAKLRLPGNSDDWPPAADQNAAGSALNTGQPQSAPLPDDMVELTIPLAGHNHIVGLLVLHLESAHFLANDTDGLLPLLANQLATALENRQLVQQVQKELTVRKRVEENLLVALKRTESLYKIGSILATETRQQAAFEVVLSEYLRLINVTPAYGAIILFRRQHGYSKVDVMIIDGQPVETALSFPAAQDTVASHLAHHRQPLVIDNVLEHPLTQHSPQLWQHDAAIRTLIFTPLISQDAVIGAIMAGSVEEQHTFAPEHIELGQAISDQLAIWLENRQLLSETKYHSEQLGMAAEVSRAASSILDVDQLIDTSVNLIRDQFNFYYVGLFLLDESGEWAVLRAGTGEAGKIQLARNHRLKIGGESMIGWSVANRKARIALDVGADAVHFRNPILPDTHSEMALPLVSRDRALGALTVQSIQSGAFSEEDITLLQSLADQLANAIANAHLFEDAAAARLQAEQRLRQTQALQHLSQQLAATLDQAEILQIFFTTCIAEIGFDYVQMALIDSHRNVAYSAGGVGVSQNLIAKTVQPLEGHHILADIVRSGSTEIISGWDERLDRDLFEQEKQDDWARLFTPVQLRHQHIGVVEAGYNQGLKSNISDNQIEMLKAFISQTALALDNARRYQASQRRAQREALIKDITTKVRASTRLDDVLQTTVKELGDAIPSSRAFIHLTPVADPEPHKQPPPLEIKDPGRGATHE